MENTINQYQQEVGYGVSSWVSPKFPRDIIIPSKYCSLEPLDYAKHLDELYSVLSKSLSDWTYLPFGPFQTKADFAHHLEKSSHAPDSIYYVITDFETKQILGMLAYLRINLGYGSIEIGSIQFSKKMQNKPIGTEAIYLLIKYAFDLGYRRVEWKCDSLNQRSYSAALRYGFKYEGTFEQAMVYKGRNRDTSWFSITDKRWKVLQPMYDQWLNESNFEENGQQIVSLSSLTKF